VRAQARLTRALGHDLERHGISVTGFSFLVVMQSAGGSLELRTLRQRLGISKANASEVAATLVSRGLVDRRRSPRDRRAVTLWLTPAGERTLMELFPDHAGRVRDAFVPLEADEKRELARLCRKLDRAHS
jgi:DNA-binding MarR family transcriptional regulator